LECCAFILVIIAAPRYALRRIRMYRGARVSTADATVAVAVVAEVAAVKVAVTVAVRVQTTIETPLDTVS